MLRWRVHLFFFYFRTGRSLKTAMAANLVPVRGGCAWCRTTGREGEVVDHTTAQAAQAATSRPRLEKRRSAASGSFKKRNTTVVPNLVRYSWSERSMPSGVISAVHFATFKGSIFWRGWQAAAAMRSSICAKISGSTCNSPAFSGLTSAMSASTSSLETSCGMMRIFGSSLSAKARSWPGRITVLFSCSRIVGSTLRSGSDPSPGSWLIAFAASHSLNGFSLKKQFTPYFVEVLGGIPKWIVRLSSTPGAWTLDHITAAPLRGMNFSPRSGKKVSPPSFSGRSFK